MIETTAQQLWNTLTMLPYCTAEEVQDIHYLASKIRDNTESPTIKRLANHLASKTKEYAI